MATQLVAPYRMQGTSGKNDANDAAAICEAASRPRTRFVSVNTPAQPGILCAHRLREGFKSERTACINRIRGLLAEFGLAFPQSPKQLRAVLMDVIEDASNDMSGLARVAIREALSYWRYLDERLIWCAQRIAARLKEDELAKQAMILIGVGQLTASGIVATAGIVNLSVSSGRFTGQSGKLGSNDHQKAT